MCSKPSPRRPSRLRSAAPSSSRVDSAHGREPPVLGDGVRAVRIDAEVGLGVADVDDEKHAVFYYSSGGPARRTSWPGPSRSSRSLSRTPDGSASSGQSSSSGTSTNLRELTSACGSVSRWRRVLEVAEQQHVDVDHARPVTGAAGRRDPAHARPPCTRRAAARARVPCGRAGRRCKTKAGRAPARPARSRTPTRTRPPRRRVRRARRPRIPDARAGRRCWNRAPDNRSASPDQSSASGPASRQTSTDTSVTGSASGGSGLAALTQIAETSHWLRIRSAIAVQSRSSVL